MAKVFRPSTREASILSKIESSRELARRKALSNLRDCVEPLAQDIAMKLVESELVETTSKQSLEDQIVKCLNILSRSDDFEIDYQIAPVRNLVKRPHVVTIYVTAFVLENLINHKDVIDIYGSDEDIYECIHSRVAKHLPD